MHELIDTERTADDVLDDACWRTDDRPGFRPMADWRRDFETCNDGGGPTTG